MKIFNELSVLFAIATVLNSSCLFQSSRADEAAPKPATLSGDDITWDKEKRNGAAKIELAIGQELFVRLSSNPSTGYTWKVTKMDSDQLKEVDEPKFEEPTKKELVGAPGKHVFRFKVLKAGSSTLELRYARPFAPDQDPTNIKIEVTTKEAK